MAPRFKALQFPLISAMRSLAADANVAAVGGTVGTEEVDDAAVIDATVLGGAVSVAPSE